MSDQRECVVLRMIHFSGATDQIKTDKTAGELTATRARVACTRQVSARPPQSVQTTVHHVYIHNRYTGRCKSASNFMHYLQCGIYIFFSYHD